MSEALPTVIGQRHDALEHIAEFVDYAKTAGAVILSGLSLGIVGTSVGGFVSAGTAEAQTSGTAELATTGHTKQVEEYVSVIAKNATGTTVSSTQPSTFIFVEQCKDGSKKVSHKVPYVKSDQPLGDCNIGSKVTVTEEKPLSGVWENKSATEQRILKATRNNNHHFVFVEQEEPTLSVPVITTPTTPSAPVEPAPSPLPITPIPPTQPPPSTDPYTSGDVGVDISWPQCAGNEAPPSSDYTGDNFGIVDVTDGLGYSTNPCLAGEAADFTSNELSLYVNTGWDINSAHNTGTSPDTCEANDVDCEAFDYGYNAGLYAYGAALSLGITSPTWWLDVETDSTWSNNTIQNQNSLQGEHDALLAEGATTVGVYSTTAQWQGLTSSWQNDWPSWGATTWTTAPEAATYCTGHEFTGGPSYLMQFTPTEQLDQDYAC